MSSLRSLRPFRRAAATCSWLLLGIVLQGCGGEITGPVGALEEGSAGRWSTLPPEAVSLSASVLGELEDDVDAGLYGTVSSLLILRSGTLVYERYWGPWGPSDTHPVYSVTKSVSSLAFGIAHGDGDIPTLDTPLLDIVPFAPPLPEQAAKEAITLRHVLQMRTGLEWDELSTNYQNGENPTVDLVASSDWVRHVLELPMAGEAGGAFTYNSGVSLLMAAVVDETTGQSLEAFTAERIFDPLEIDDWAWSAGPGGLTNSGWGLELRPRDMAAIGELVRLDGQWEGSTIVASEWLDDSRAPGTRFTDGTGYGYQWWLPEADGGGGADPMAAWGYGNQYIVVLPSIDVVMVSTAENYAESGWTPYQLAEYGYRAAAVGGAR